MSGEGKSAKDKILDIENELDEYENKIGLPSKINRNCLFFNMSYDQMRSLTPDEANEAACDLAAYGNHIQREINKHATRVNLAESNIKMIVAKEGANVYGYSYEERKYNVIANNESAAEYERIRQKSQMIIDRLSYIPARIAFLSDKLTNMAYGKRKNG